MLTHNTHANSAKHDEVSRCASDASHIRRPARRVSSSGRRGCAVRSDDTPAEERRAFLSEPVIVDAVLDGIRVGEARPVSAHQPRPDGARLIVPAGVFAAGARLVWVVDPGERRAIVRCPDRPPKVVGAGEDLDGEDVVPGFTLALAELFKPRP